MKKIFWNKLLSVVSLIIFVAFEIKAQMPAVPVSPEDEPEVAEDYTWWYLMLFLLVVGLVGVLYWRQKNKKLEKAVVQKQKDFQKSRVESSMDALDADKELEWLRKNQSVMDRKRRKKPASEQQKSATTLPQRTRKAKPKVAAKPIEEEKPNEITVPLPIFSIQRLELARPFSLLPLSNDESLMNAIEHANEDFEEEEEKVRELTVKVLAAFKTRNAAEALAQFALYDLSSGLRSKAVSALTELNHECVFEPILLACADPSREVRAAAARGLFRLDFDRADAWSRIAESGEEGRMRQAARAAQEAGFIERSVDRLVHHDFKVAYEAFSLIALLIKAEETEVIFTTLENHKDANVRRALLHVIKVTKDQNALDGLYAMLEQRDLPLEIREELDRAIEEIGYVTA